MAKKVYEGLTVANVLNSDEIDVDQGEPKLIVMVNSEMAAQINSTKSATQIDSIVTKTGIEQLKDVLEHISLLIKVAFID